MTEKQKEFLYLAVIKKLTYDEIQIKLGIDRSIFSPWWNELKEKREYLVQIRDLWHKKCPQIEFFDFKEWYESKERKCFYCNITEPEIEKLWEKYPDLTKRKRGKKLEIERLEPNLPYSITSNLVFSCYWCNNAKTDTFTKNEFSEIGKVIEQIWKKRLK
jgi:5-methylcytosine-specific restriction endonuclease McrA